MRHRRLAIRRRDGCALGGALARLSKTRRLGRRGLFFWFFFIVVIVTPIVAIVVLDFCFYPFPRLGTINVGLVGGRRARRPMRTGNLVSISVYYRVQNMDITKRLGLRRSIAHIGEAVRFG